MEFIKKFIKTRRDLSVWVMASYWLALNTIAILIWGSFGTVFSNMIGLGTIAAFVFWSRGNKKVNDWLDKEL